MLKRRLHRPSESRLAKNATLLENTCHGSYVLILFIGSSACLLNMRLIQVLLDFSLTVKAATLIFISGCGSAISSAKEGKSGLIYNLVKS